GGGGGGGGGVALPPPGAAPRAGAAPRPPPPAAGRTKSASASEIWRFTTLSRSASIDGTSCPGAAPSSVTVVMTATWPVCVSGTQSRYLPLPVPTLHEPSPSSRCCPFSVYFAFGANGRRVGSRAIQASR